MLLKSALLLMILYVQAAVGEPTPTLRVVAAGNELEVIEGAASLGKMTPKTRPEQRGSITLRWVTSAGHHMLELRIPVQGEGAAKTEVWLAKVAGKKPSVIFWDTLGPLDADAEFSRELSVTEKSIETWQILHRLSRCDGEPVRLFRQRFDFGSNAFKPVEGPLLPALPNPLEARRIDVEQPLADPLGGFFFTAASSAKGMGNDLRRWIAPGGVNDSDPATFWRAERGHPEQGQILTARASGGFPITGLRIWPGNTTNEAAFRASTRPRTLRLIFGPNQQFDVNLREDNDAGKRRFQSPFWIPLPEPIKSTCISVMVREVDKGKDPLTISGLHVMTLLDGPNAADLLLTDLASGQSCESRLPLFTRLGLRNLPPLIAKIPPTPPGPGRECLLEALATLAPKGTDLPDTLGPALVSAVKGTSAREEKILFEFFPRVSPTSLDSLIPLLVDTNAAIPDRLRSARALALVATPKAADALLTSLGQGPKDFRAPLRSYLANGDISLASYVLKALETDGPKDTARTADLLVVLGALVRRDDSLTIRALAVFRKAVEPEKPFEIQARGISGLGRLATQEAINLLIEMRPKQQSPVLRQFIVAELATHEAPQILPALRTAMEDSDPKVRETAALGLGERKDKSAVTVLIRGAEQEPWPFVRRAEVLALAELCTPEGNELLFRAFQRDEPMVRQAAMAGLSQCGDPRAMTVLIRTLGRAPEVPEVRSNAARLLGEARDRRAVTHINEALARLLVESQADLALEGVVADTAMALASIGGPKAAEGIATLLDDTRTTLARIGIEALGQLCDPTVGAQALTKAARHKETAVSVPANNAIARCKARNSAGRPQPSVDRP